MKPIDRTTHTFVGVAVAACFGLLLAACSVDSPTAPSRTPAPPVLFPQPADTVVLAAFEFTTDDDIITAIFTNTSTGEPTSAFWDFGDGLTSSEFNPVHTFADFGTYVVTLTVSDAVSSDSVSQFVIFTEPEDEDDGGGGGGP